MDRSIPLLLIGLVFGGGIGFFVAAANGVTLDGHTHDHANPAQHGAGGHDAAYATSEPVAYPAGADVPALSLSVMPDPVTGWNIHMELVNFRFAPENAGAPDASGEGHAHIYVNGVKVMRAYGDWIHLETLPQGEVTVRAALYSNDHRPIAVDGAPVGQEVVVNVD